MQFFSIHSFFSVFFCNFAKIYGRVGFLHGNVLNNDFLYIFMKKICFAFIIAIMTLSSCKGGYNSVFKSQDVDYKYEVAKQCYVAGHYTKAYQLLADLINPFKGTDKAEECLFMNGMCYFNLKDYETAVVYFDRYYKTYPKGIYTELARFYSGKASYMQSPDPRLDQTPTYAAINSLQEYVEHYPYSQRKDEINNMIYALQDRLVQKEYDSAKLYFDLGTYNGNCLAGGNNYEACIITAENAIKSFPYTKLKEDLSILILRAKFKLAQHSVIEKERERYQNTIDEYYGFKNEFPESKYIDEAEKIFRQSSNKIGV